MSKFDRADQQATFQEVVSALVTASARLPHDPLTGFMAMEGASYSGDLMWVGRAVNGWRGIGRSPLELADPGTAADFAASALRAAGQPGPGGDVCPMRWVTDHWGTTRHGYNTKRSAFWRTSKRVMGALVDEPSSTVKWVSRMVWSNLYKVAPAAGWNPGSKVAEAQLDGCRKLLSVELATYKPRHLVFATGMDWAAPFLDPIMFRQTSGSTAPVVYGDLVLEDVKIGRYAVPRHPMGKDEGDWVQQVVAALHGD
ncbi:hypothetical protein [Devosia sp. A16]|uniref:hypothetical protein n=1 Tax=Devosia sp. A16 TaxID=1736675 RepID=UPI000A9E4FC6|nr:hypothetical protein [Devosia sp. A16]